MSESILQGLMQLFAIVAKLDGVKPSERNVVRLFLSHQLNQVETEKYLRIFDEFAIERNKKNKTNTSTEEGRSFISVRDSSRMLIICSKINAELSQPQKVMVLVRLLELVFSDREMSTNELDFVMTVAGVFNVEKENFEKLKAFIIKPNIDNLDLSDLLFIDDEITESNHRKHLFNISIEGRIALLKIPKLDMFLLRYFGNENYVLNSEVIVPRLVYNFPLGSTVRGRKLKTIYYSDVVNKFMDYTDSQKLSFRAENISYQFADGSPGIQKLSLHEFSGNLVGIMGSSGSGKSTLLEVLNGNLTPNSGIIRVNNENYFLHKKKLKNIIGYVPQDDKLIGHLSVYKNLYFAAKLSYGNYTDLQLHHLIDNLLTRLELQDVAHLRVGSSNERIISGGQRKRLNIGLELIREPDILFVDEPTSGLSSQDSENIIAILKELTMKGKLVFVVIHQPSSDIFKMFDRLLILDKGGLPIYYGNPLDSIQYFRDQVNQISEDIVCPSCGNVEPEQVFEIIETKVVNEYGRFTDKRRISPQQWYKIYLENKVSTRTKTIKQEVKVTNRKPNKLQQFKIFLKRDALAKLNNRQYLWITLTQAPILAILLGYATRFQPSDQYVLLENVNLPVYFFMSVIVSLFLGLIISAEEIHKDKQVVKRESFLNLSRFSYLNSKILVLFLISALQALLYTWIGNAILEIKDYNFNFWLTLFSCAAFANLLGLNISSAFNSVAATYIVIPILLIPQIILGGIVLPFDEINPKLNPEKKVPAVSNTITSRWAFEALAVDYFKNNTFEKNFFNYDQQLSNILYAKDYLIPALKQQIKQLHKMENQMEQEQMKASINKNLLQLQLTPTIDLVDDFSGLNQFLDAHANELMKEYIRVLELKNKHVKKYKASNDFVNNKNTYTNERLAIMVKKSQSLQRIIEKDDVLYRNIFPIYIKVEKAFINLSPQFFSPNKYILYQKLETLPANLMAIWSMSMALYILLYFDLLKRGMQKRSWIILGTQLRSLIK
ncbi:MAG: ATP-binding cassette domain-containing protein [Cyclobacteriaceae bacterium]|nr:ATP-binding cassette domain-containing protein [Cyclobacteriaceae bacterium]MCH8516580.1 ATP-binding cassette domain-containing protein [Cyclobacteriaceae bacterium]